MTEGFHLLVLQRAAKQRLRLAVPEGKVALLQLRQSRKGFYVWRKAAPIELVL